MKKLSKFICEIDQEDIDKNSDLSYIDDIKPGFFFIDETGGFIGPYETQEEAEISYEVYCDAL